MIKSLLLGRGSVSREIFLGEVNEGVGDGRVVGNELLVEIGEV